MGLGISLTGDMRGKGEERSTKYTEMKNHGCESEMRLETRVGGSSSFLSIISYPPMPLARSASQHGIAWSELCCL